MKILDPEHPFYAPVWRRVAVVALCLGWSLVEILAGSTGWAILTGALGLWCLYEFFLSPAARRRARGESPDRDG
ncbi:hypothetical protein [Wenxinia saemankumensis]|uniref:DUF3329 domain-containing protein n=1 Tax=Wenxinia saemankumensis TaxID=1447782 RepID=A0A1M6DXQ0_9RHOB|nr:hypothetical protein [Wenxinia saemankumensis]SHI78067.1 hypothetical protein SAMN05444417_1670 [Wenxinia saemankumensis]